MSNIPLLTEALSELTRCAALPEPRHPETFFLDHNNSLEDRESMLFELNRLLDNLYFDPIAQKVALRDLKPTKASPEFMECIRRLGALVHTFQESNILNVQAHIATADTAMSEALMHPNQANLTAAQKEAVSAFRATCGYIKTQFIAPIFKERYGMVAQSSAELAEAPSDRITIENRIPFPQRNKPSLSFYERTLTRMGLGFRRFASRTIGSNQLHVFDGHGAGKTPLTEEYEIGAKLEGGDMLLVSCYQDKSTVKGLLEKLTHPGIRRRASRRRSGAIHLQNKEVLCSLPVTHGAVYTAMSRTHNHTPSQSNPFVRTTLANSNQTFENRSYTTDIGQRVHLQRSNSGTRLYLGSEEHYFENRVNLLKQHYQERMQAYKKLDPTLELYDFSIDFDHLNRLNLTELELSYLDRLIDDQKDFRFLAKTARNETGNQLNIRSIMVMLETKLRGEEISQHTRPITNINYMEKLMTDLLQKEVLMDNRLKQKLTAVMTYMNSDALMRHWAQLRSQPNYRDVFNNSLRPDQVSNITKVTPIDNYENIRRLEYAVGVFRANTRHCNSDAMNTLLDGLRKDLSHKMELLKQGKSPKRTVLGRIR